MLGVYADVSMYKNWIDEIMSAKKLPDYEHSPFPKPPPTDSKDNNGADQPKYMTTIEMLFAVIISMIFN